jgi:hypothetical protein
MCTDEMIPARAWIIMVQWWTPTTALLMSLQARGETRMTGRCLLSSARD